jgi:hypothetical protein
VPDFETLSQFLDAQTERKLQKMRDGIRGKIDNLATELQMVESALARKRPKVRAEPAVAPANGSKTRNGQLSRAELYRYVVEVGHPVKAAEMRTILAEKGIIRRVEAVRTSLVRLEADGKLKRGSDGRFGVAASGGVGAEAEDQFLAGPAEEEGATRSPDG